MGNPASKIGQEIKEDELTEGSLPSTPILTPKIRSIDLDPRSPSNNILRTPIQISFTHEKKLTECSTIDPQKNEEEHDTFNMSSPQPKVVNIDPRSPTTDFTRTPILITETEESTDTLPLKLHNKNLDNARKALITYTPIKSTYSAKINKAIPPKLLNSSPIVARPNDSKRKSFVGLLETNLDFVETDLDKVIQSKSPVKQIDFVKEASTPKTKLSTNDELFYTPNAANVCKNNDIDPRSPTTDFVRTPIQIFKKIGELDLNEFKDEESLSSENEVENHREESNGNIIDDIDDDGLKISNNLSRCTDKTANITDTVPKVNTPDIQNEVQSLPAGNIKEFDKKLANLIYEDKDTDVVIKSVTVKDNKRTPLGIRNHNSNPKKSVPKLKVSDKPRKCDKELSKIPVFKDKRVKAKLSQQCENTPPKNIEELRNTKIKKSHWDPDSSLVI